MLHRLLFVLLLAALPQPIAGKRVHDFARVLSGPRADRIEALAQAVEKETTAQVAVVTVSSLEGRTVDDYAYDLFNRWGIGSREVNNGVLFLIAPSERRVRIEVGYGLEPLLTDSVSGEILDHHVIPYFKQNAIEEGIEAGANEIVRILRAYPDAARGVPGSAPSYVQSPRRQAITGSIIAAAASGVFLVLGVVVGGMRKRYSPVLFGGAALAMLLCAAYAAYLTFTLPGVQQPIFALLPSLGAGLVALIYNTKKFLRFGPHRCPQCASPMQLLSEQEEDKKLEEVQRLEEKLGSVDYDVWFCSACLRTDVDRYVRWFSGFSQCPKCAKVTYKEESTTVRRATTMRTGLRRLDGHCVACDHRTSRTVTIPRVSSSSSRSGSSGGGRGGFGGGSSGGGGASRGW